MDPNQPVQPNTNVPNQAPLQPVQSPQSIPPAPLEPQPKQHTHKTIIAMILVVTLMVTAVAIVLFMSPKKAAQPVPAVNSAPVKALASSGSLSESDIQSLDKTNAFWAYFKNAAQQSTITTTKEYYFSDGPNVPPLSRTFKQTGFDYASKKMVQAIDMPDSDLADRVKYRCFDGKEYVRTSIRSDWHEQEAEDKTYCRFGSESISVNDGINTGGLTADQSEKMIQTLRRQEGLVTVDKLKLTEKQGKQYLRFEVTLHPLPTNEENIYMGNQWWMWAFKETGMDPETHPFAYIGAGGNGSKITYIVDPSTQLPVYSEIGTTPLKDTQGKDKPGDSYSFYRTQYAFGSMPDVAITNEKDVTLDW